MWDKKVKLLLSVKVGIFPDQSIFHDWDIIYSLAVLKF